MNIQTFYKINENFSKIVPQNYFSRWQVRILHASIIIPSIKLSYLLLSLTWHLQISLGLPSISVFLDCPQEIILVFFCPLVFFLLNLMNLKFQWVGCSRTSSEIIKDELIMRKFYPINSLSIKFGVKFYELLFCLCYHFLPNFFRLPLLASRFDQGHEMIFFGF